MATIELSRNNPKAKKLQLAGLDSKQNLTLFQIYGQQNQNIHFKFFISAYSISFQAPLHKTLHPQAESKTVVEFQPSLKLMVYFYTH